MIMSRRLIISGIAVLLGLAVFVTLLTPAAAQDMGKGPQFPATPTPDVTPIPGATPTIDRLAAPPTVASPTQADEGAQLFWLHCQPCHGDAGQGLTDEWRAQYPPEDQNCWQSGCHGPRPYELGFILPTAVPAIIGDGTLARFQTLDGVYQYVSVAMPYFFPGDLTQEEYLAITAHIARENGLGDGATLTLDNMAGYRLPWATAAVADTTADEPPHQAAAQATPPPPAAATPVGGLGVVGLGLIVAALLVVFALGGIVLWLRRSRSI